MGKLPKYRLRLFVAAIGFLIFISGSVYIVWSQRPVAKMAQQNPEQSNVSGTTKYYTMDDIAVHKTKDDCWSAVNGGVYDLTSFVFRHPGGVKNIMKICGIDGSDLFNRQHGKSKKVNAVLILLKIGELQP